MALVAEIKEFSRSIPAQLEEKHGVYELSFVLAERKVFLSRRRLEYRAKFRIDDAGKLVKFTEMLRESGSGLSSGDTAPGFGFKKESYRIRGKLREGSIEEQSTLFGKKYQYRFDYRSVRSKLQEMAAHAGYRFECQITATGL